MRQCLGTNTFRWIYWLLPGVVLVFITIAGSNLNAQESLTQNQRAKLATGAVLIDVSLEKSGSEARVRAVLDIPVSTKVIWNVLLDCERAPQFLTGLESCRILKMSRDGLWDLREHRVRWSWFFPEMQCIVRSDYVVNRVIRFRRTGGDLRSLKGNWTFQEIHAGDATRLFYESHIDPGWVLPGGLTRSVLLQDVPIMLRALRREAIRVAASG